jgi:hypothetical protein
MLRQGLRGPQNLSAQANVTEQKSGVAVSSQEGTFDVPASPRSNPIHATLFPEVS